MHMFKITICAIREPIDEIPNKKKRSYLQQRRQRRRRIRDRKEKRTTYHHHIASRPRPLYHQALPQSHATPRSVANTVAPVSHATGAMAVVEAITLFFNIEKGEKESHDYFTVFLLQQFHHSSIFDGKF
ncbi:hypothetical protein SESBI_38319 [Sesbania bispinosa]|nr:hypothetical protein SESBI_38319 [Sesbania bispinosa]